MRTRKLFFVFFSHLSLNLPTDAISLHSVWKNHSQQVPLLPELSQVRGNLCTLSQVDFVRTSDDTRIDVLRIVPKCLFPCADSHALHPGVGRHLSWTSTSSRSGFRHEGGAVSLTTSGPLFSFSTHRGTVLTRTTCPISFTTRCPSLSSVRPTHIDRNVRGAPFATTRTSAGFRSGGTKRTFNHREER